MIFMKNSKQFVVTLSFFCWLAFSGCSKLQDGYDYQSSFYDTKIDMTVMDFMKSRPDLFSDMLAAIDYVAQDSAYKDVLEMYSSTGNTFLLLHNNALTNLDDVNSYWSLNPVMGPDPNEPSQTITMKGSAWSQYSRDTIANLLRYHVLKGTQTYSTLNSTPKWVDTYALSETNDSAKVYIYLENVREANLRLNNYTDVPTTYKGTTINWADIAPRTPDLHATNGVMHVMNKWLFEPTRESIQNN
jgi:uncharacterized surface protein with fasciclin (FAS1) repeats